jgi:hypothetical protein
MRLATLYGSVAVVVALCMSWGAARPAVAGDTAGAYFKEERWGYRVRVPKDWNQAAMSAREEWIASKHISTQEVQLKKSDQTNWWFRMHPEMWVIAFPHARQEQRGARLDTSKEDEGVVSFKINNPYKDYKDFVKREQWFVGGGYHFSKEEEGEIEGMKVSMYEIKVEKMADAPMRIVTWVYRADDVDFAIQFKTLEDHYDGSAQAFTACLKSFRRIPRAAAMPGSAVTGESIVEDVDESKLTPEQKQERRRDLVERTLTREIEALPKGWIHIRSANYVALSKADEKFTRQILDYAEIVRNYLDTTFQIGNDYVPPGIIRIFTDQTEETAFFQGTGNLFEGAEQITVTKRQGEERSWEYEYLGRRITSQWVQFRNTDLWMNMPWWISEGLSRHMAFARPKGKRIEFQPDPYDKETLRELVKKGNAIPLKELLQGGAQFNEWGQNIQAGSVVSWLLTDGNRGKCKNAMVAYVQALVKAVEEEEKAFEERTKATTEKEKKRIEGQSGNAGGDDEDEDDEDEDADEKATKEMIEEMKKSFKDKWEGIRKKSFDAVFGSFTDADWQKLDTAWRKFAT